MTTSSWVYASIVLLVYACLAYNNCFLINPTGDPTDGIPGPPKRRLQSTGSYLTNTSCSIYTVTPGESWTSIASTTGIPLATLLSANPTAQQSNGQALSAWQAINIPCSSGSQGRTNQATTGTFTCPDAEDATQLFQELRASVGQPGITWSTTLETQLIQALQQPPLSSSLCPTSPNLTASLPNNPLTWWGNYSAINGTLVSSCGASVVGYWQLVRDSAGDSVGQSVGQANPTVDGGASGVTGGALYRGVPSGVVQAAQVAIVSNVTREYACALQVCGTSRTQIYCAFNAPSSTRVSPEALTNFALDAGDGECPSTIYNPSPGGSVASVASSQGIAFNQLLCYGGYINSAGTAVPALALPCAGSVETSVSCEALQLSTTPLPRPMRYTLQPGENFTTLVTRFGLPYTPCALCCANNYSSETVYGFAACSPPPLTSVLLPAGNVSEAVPGCACSNTPAAVTAASTPAPAPTPTPTPTPAPTPTPTPAPVSQPGLAPGPSRGPAQPPEPSVGPSGGPSGGPAVPAPQPNTPSPQPAPAPQPSTPSPQPAPAPQPNTPSPQPAPAPQPAAVSPSFFLPAPAPSILFSPSPTLSPSAFPSPSPSPTTSPTVSPLFANSPSPVASSPTLSPQSPSPTSSPSSLLNTSPQPFAPAPAPAVTVASSSLSTAAIVGMAAGIPLGLTALVALLVLAALPWWRRRAAASPRGTKAPMLGGPPKSPPPGPGGDTTTGEFGDDVIYASHEGVKTDPTKMEGMLSPSLLSSHTTPKSPVVGPLYDTTEYAHAPGNDFIQAWRDFGQMEEGVQEGDDAQRHAVWLHAVMQASGIIADGNGQDGGDGGYAGEAVLGGAMMGRAMGVAGGVHQRSSDGTGVAPGASIGRQHSTAAGVERGISMATRRVFSLIPDEEVMMTMQQDAQGQWQPKKLGEGGYGTVYEATYQGMPVAVKVMRNSGVPTSMAMKVLGKEVAVLQRCNSQHMVAFLGACITEGALKLVFELMEGGTLFEKLHDDEKGRVEEWRWSARGKHVAVDVAAALVYLHEEAHVIHADCKSLNVLLTGDGRAKLADLGMSKVIGHQSLVSHGGAVGSLLWAAPEVFFNSRITKACDVYSFGVVLYEIITGEVPPRDRQFRTPRVPEECSSAVADLMWACLAKEPDQRPTARRCWEILSAEAREGGGA